MLRCVLFLGDGATNYLSKFIMDEWLIGNGHIKGREALETITKNSVNPNIQLLADKTIMDYDMFKPLPKFDNQMTIADCFEVFKKGHVAIPIFENNKLLGVIEKPHLTRVLVQLGIKKSSTCYYGLGFEYFKVDILTSMVVLEKLLQTRNFVLLEKKNGETIEELYCITQNDMFNILEQSLEKLL